MNVLRHIFFPKFIILIFSIIGISVEIPAAENQELSPKTVKLLETLNTRQNIVYKTVDGEALDMVLFLPEKSAPGKMPIMLYTHGGGWGGGDKFNIFRNVFFDTLKILLDNGIACASIEYRLTEAGKSTAVDCVVDCMDAARFLVKNAEELNIDPDRMGVWGGSAGGHLALMTGLADPSLFPGDKGLSGFDPQFKCIASYYPAVSFIDTQLFKGSNFERPQRMVPMLGGLLEDKREEAALISPVEHLRVDSPSIMLLHGDDDKVLPYANAEYFMKVARKAGADVRLVTVKGGGHGFSGGNISPSMEEIGITSADFIINELADWSWPEPDPSAVREWQELRFGMFIHWGPVSLTGHEIGWSRGRQTPIEAYDQLYKQFNPEKFSAEDWVLTAKAAGMKYLVITTKHHDGFCLWPSDVTNYDIAETPFRRDVLKELSEACRKHGIRFGAYYSVCDWYDPAFPLGNPRAEEADKPAADLKAYDHYLRAQVRELVEDYGPLVTMWFDVPQVYDFKYGVDMVKELRALQPDIIINNRAFSDGRLARFGHQVLVGDYSTPEQKIGEFNMERPWETCMTICKQWAWKPNDTLKSLEECVHTLVRTNGGDGNLLLNVGPMPDGRIEPRQVERLKEMGEWLKKNGKSIYGTRGGPFLPGEYGASTHKDNKIFVHVLKWPGKQLVLPAIPGKILSAKLMDGTNVFLLQSDDSVQISVPESMRDPIDTIVVLDLAD